MSEPEVLEREDTTAEDKPSPEETTKNLRQGLWRLKPNVVLRVEEDGAILFDPDTDALAVINVMASTLLQWQRDHICLDEWCEALHTRYRGEIDRTQIQKDLEGFLDGIAFFTEACDDTCD